MSTQAPPKGGRMPLSQKKPAGSRFRQSFGNRLQVDGDLHKEITDQGLEYRWIDAKKLHANQGYHQNGWTAYRRKNPVSDFKLGNDPDGVVRRGTMILGVRERGIGEDHRDYLKERARAYSGRSIQKEAADELRQMSKNTGIKISEGYDADKGEEDDE